MTVTSIEVYAHHLTKADVVDSSLPHGESRIQAPSILWLCHSLKPHHLYYVWNMKRDKEYGCRYI